MKQLITLIFVACIAISSYIGNIDKKEAETSTGSFINAEKEMVSKINKETGIDKVRNFLEKNKVFFEVFSYLVVGIMGIIISYVGWKTNNKTKKIYEEQLKILENDRQPCFVLKVKENVNFFSKKIESETYEVINIGGRISNAYIDVNPCLNVTVTCKKTEKKYVFNYLLPNRFDFLGNGKLFSGPAVYFEDSKDFMFFKHYIFSSKEEENKEKSEITTEIKEKINNKINNIDINIEDKIYATIEYTNYENKRFCNKYEIKNNDIIALQEHDKNIIYFGKAYNSNNLDFILSFINLEILENEINLEILENEINHGR